MIAEVGPASPGNVDLGGDDAVIGSGLDTLPVALNVLDGLPHVTLDIEGESRGFGDGETEVKSNDTRDTSETDEETPAEVNAVGRGGGIRKDGAFVGVHDDEGNEGGTWKRHSINTLTTLAEWRSTYRNYRNPGQRRWQSSYDHESEWKQTRRR